MCAKRTLTGWVLGLFALALLLASGASAAQLRVTAVGARHEERAGTAKPAVRISATLQCPSIRRIIGGRWLRRWVPGHYEYQMCRVLVEKGHYERRYVPGRTITRRGPRGRKRTIVTPGHYIRVWVPDRYEMRRVKVWVPGHFAPPGSRRRGRDHDHGRSRGRDDRDDDHGRGRGRDGRDDHGRDGGRGGRRS